MRTLSMHHDAVHAHGRALSLKAIAAAVMARIVTWQIRSRERQILAHMDDRMLSDVGLTRGQVRGQLERGFWER